MEMHADESRHGEKAGVRAIFLQQGRILHARRKINRSPAAHARFSALMRQGSELVRLQSKPEVLNAGSRTSAQVSTDLFMTALLRSKPSLIRGAHRDRSLEVPRTWPRIALRRQLGRKERRCRGSFTGPIGQSRRPCHGFVACRPGARRGCSTFSLILTTSGMIRIGESQSRPRSTTRPSPCVRKPSCEV